MFVQVDGLGELHGAVHTGEELLASRIRVSRRQSNLAREDGVFLLLVEDGNHVLTAHSQ